MIKLFEFMKDAFKPLPDMRRHADMLAGIETAICGMKNWRKCEFGNDECPTYCSKGKESK